MEGIRIPIGAPLDQLTKDLSGADRQLKTFASGAAKSAGVLGGSLTAGSNSAAFALTNLGRVAQDAPFGFIGIQNNLNPLLESFQRLKAETGSTGGALKALAGSLMGPAGLGIAFSVVSAAILFYQQYQQRATKVTKQAADQYDLYNGAIRDGNKEAGQQLANLDSLYKATINVANSQGTRNKAATELISLSNGVFNASDRERLKNGELGAAYKSLTEDIIANARAKALQDKIAGLTSQKLDAEIKLQKIAIANTNEAAKATNNRQEIGLGQAIIYTKEQQIKASNQRAEAATKETKAVISGLEQQMTFLAKMQGGDKNVVNAIVGTDKNKGAAKGGITEAQKKELDFQKKLLDFRKEGNAFAGNLEILKVSNSVAIAIEKETESQKKFNTELEAATIYAEKMNTEIYGTKPSVTAKLTSDLTEWQTYVNGDLLPKVQENFTTFFNDILMNGKLSFDSLGKAILNTFLSVIASDAAAQLTNLLQFKTDGADKGKGGILKGLAGLLGIGAKAAPAVTGGTAATVATGAAATGGVLLPILAGIAAVAGIASLFKKKQPAQVAQVAPVNYASSASMSSVNDSFSGGRVVFEISGVNLIGVLNRAGAKLKRFGP